MAAASYLQPERFLDIQPESYPSIPSTTQHYLWNGREVSIDIAKVPVISDLCITHLDIQLPPSFKKPAPLMKQIQKLKDIHKMLQEEQANGCQHKSYGILKTASSAAIVGGAIVACVIGGTAGLTAGLTGGLISHVLASSCLWDNGVEKIRAIEDLGPTSSHCWKGACCLIISDEGYHWTDMLIASLGKGTVIPIYEAFSRKGRLERVFQEQREAVLALLSEYEKENNANLPGACQFYTEQFQKVTEYVNQKRETLEKSLHSMQALSERSPQGEKELEQRLAEWTQIRDELNAMHAFYQRHFLEILDDQLATSI